jgi:hypothetical protein
MRQDIAGKQNLPHVKEFLSNISKKSLFLQI